ncbi:indoleamine 2,3-dioxygenase 2-like [Gouania willdenowi]|uniref:Indoleamine 2,3-dioxygenase 2-like n=1 Tax=Gouania willdenowi TaxID=441366 RepID=A0A8C5GVZ9_GOUWI|nr:indoleamine 2,3-dioxygenase 2-like [Gouania willdenowi]
MEANRETLLADFDAFDISEKLGFVLEEPLTNLPDYYRIWIDLANNLTHLIESHKLRGLVDQMPVLSPHYLRSHHELRLAHLALGFLSMGYVWQEGENGAAEILPKALAIPYWLVSRRLGIPPILTYADSVLANWKLRDPTGDMDVDNMELIFSFPGGESCRGFFIVSLLVELVASSGIKGALEVMHAMESSDSISVQKGLMTVTDSLKEMKEMFKLMHGNVDPSAFYGTLRIFVSGWRDNPMLPNGLLYEGVSSEPILLSGGSAAQSSTIQCFDALLGIEHKEETSAFLIRMRDYMPPTHRQLVETLSVCPPLRDFVLSNANDSDLRQAYNTCVNALVDLRNYHLNAVAKYIIVPGSMAQSMGCPMGGVSKEQEPIGTGGTNLMVFLKTARNSAQNALIEERTSVPEHWEL